MGDALADVGRVTAGGWLDIDVTAAVPGDGIVAFVRRPTSNDGLDLSSAQGAHPPRLIVETVPGD